MRRGTRSTLLNVAIESLARNGDYGEFWEYVQKASGFLNVSQLEVERLLETYKDLVVREAFRKQDEFESLPKDLKLGDPYRD